MTRSFHRPKSNSPDMFRAVYSLALILTAVGGSTAAWAHGSSPVAPHQAPGLQFAAIADIPADLPRLGVGDLHVSPVGPLGLEIPDAVRALDGFRVRMYGFMATEVDPSPGRFLLLAHPMEIDSLHEGGAGDIPPSAVFVRLPGTHAEPAPFVPGLVSFTGTLELGAREEPDGLVSTFRLFLDDPSASLLERAIPLVATASHKGAASH